MLRAFESELIKLRRRWMVLGTFGPLLTFAVASTMVQFILSDKAGPENLLKSPAQLARPNGIARVLMELAPFAGVVVVVVFASGFATEFGWGTLRNLLVRQPNRSSLLAGKFLALLDFVFVGTVITAAGTMITAWVMGQVKDIPVDAWFTAAGLSALGASGLNFMLSTVGWASLGAFAALILRSPGGAVGAVLAFLPIEGLINGWWDKGPRWLPGALFAAVANGGSMDVSYQRALALTLGYSLAAMSLALWLFIRSDVTA